MGLHERYYGNDTLTDDDLARVQRLEESMADIKHRRRFAPAMLEHESRKAGRR